jgi:hypothetical protein
MSKMNPCFLLGNPEQTPLARGARVGVAHRRQEEIWRLPVRPLEAVLRGPCADMYGSSGAAAAWTRSRAVAPRCPSSNMETSWSSLMPTTLGLFWAPQPTTLALFWAPQPTTTPSCRPAHHPPEAQPAT